jgi:hypothetical protein
LLITVFPWVGATHRVLPDAVERLFFGSYANPAISSKVKLSSIVGGLDSKSTVAMILDMATAITSSIYGASLCGYGALLMTL